MHLFSGIVQCISKGNADGSVARDALTFNVGRVNIVGSTPPLTALHRLARELWATMAWATILCGPWTAPGNDAP